MEAKRSNKPADDSSTERLLNRFEAVRARTMRIVSTLEVDDYVVQTAPFMSPPKWHIGHTSWFFEMLLKDYLPGYQVFSEDYLFFFNSYYERFGQRVQKDKRGARSRPTLLETRAYRNRIDVNMRALFDCLDALAEADKVKTLVRLGLEHEMQHQELLVYDIKHLLCDLYDVPDRAALPIGSSVAGMAEIGGGLVWIGDRGGDFAFDNEKPSHRTFLEDYAIGRAPVSNGQYLEFMNDGGYRDYRWWLSEGWNYIQNERWDSPMYWEKR